jgi:hypothetical protein
MASSKRKAMVDTSDFPKKVKLWYEEGLDGLTKYFNLRPFESLGE